MPLTRERFERSDVTCSENRHMTDKSRSYGSAPNGMSGMVWFAGWLFTIGYLKLAFWKGVLGLIVWPYFLGASLT